MQRRLLVAHENVAEILLLVDFVIDGKHCPARITENVFYTFGMKRLDDDFGA